MKLEFDGRQIFLILCWVLTFFCFAKVALGATRDLLAADYSADKLPKGKHSVFAKGSIAPDPKEELTL